MTNPFRAEEVAFSVGGKKRFLVRQGEGWAVRDRPAPDGVLAADSPVSRVGTHDSPAIRLDGGDLVLPRDWTPQRRREVGRKVVALIGNDYGLARAGSRRGELKVEVLEALRRDKERLKAATPLRLVAEGKDSFRLVDGGEAITLAELEKDDLPGAWRTRLRDKVCILDVSGLAETGDRRQLQDVAAKVAELGKKHRFSAVLSVGAEGARERAAGLLEWGTLTIAPESRGLGRKPGFWLRTTAARWLNLQRGWSAGRGTNLEVRVEHFVNGATEAQLLAEVEAGKFAGKDVVLVVCLDNPPFFLRLARLALAKGARSMTIQGGKVDIPGALLTAEGMKNNPAFRALGDGATPREFWARGERETIALLKRCDPLEFDRDVRDAVHKEFPKLELTALSAEDARAVRQTLPRLGTVPLTDAEVASAVARASPGVPDAPRLFFTGGEASGTFSRKALHRSIKAMEAQQALWLQLVIRTQDGRPGRLDGRRAGGARAA
jgi:hypothetical protein